MNVAKTLRRANKVFESLNSSIDAPDLKKAHGIERKFRECVVKFDDYSEAQIPHAIRLMTNRVRMVLWMANSKADAKSVTDWILA